MKKILMAGLVLICCAAALAGCGRGDGRNEGIQMINFGTYTPVPMTTYTPVDMEIEISVPEPEVLPVHLKYMLYESCFCDVPLDELKTEADLARVTRLSIGFDGRCDYMPFSIEALKYFPNLESLGISKIPVVDLEAIAQLKKLKILTLNECDLQDISPIGELENLYYLDLSNNDITDPAPLSGMKKLESLWLSGNEITSLEGLAGMETLKNLALEYTMVTDFTPLKTVPNLRSLDISKIAWRFPDAEIAFSGIEELVQLESLDVSQNDLKSIDFLRPLTGLRELLINYNEIPSLEPLKEHRQIYMLIADNNPLGNLNDVAALEALEILNISDCRIRSLEPLCALKKLRKLDVSSLFFDAATANMILDYSPIARMEALEEMSISREDIYRLEPLAGKTDVKLAYPDVFFGEYKSIEELLAEAKAESQED